ncbi:MULTISPECIES: hypothetical protein [unclassified Acinetobacter]|uniref:hypothetical protein n=1 Tax=unclassified Acinetobacter TaxID=196816 RepID=UPI00287E1EAD|nr:hypothetical protein [Acinetobacter sp. V117_2]MDS7965610.1 hypothetical protein [Acinetobacter sp. V117_2]
MEVISIRPNFIKTFNNPNNDYFCIVTNESLEDKIKITDDSNYIESKIILYKPNDRFENLLENVIPENSHVLVISPDVFFQSPDQKHIGSKRKLIAMACNSTPTDINAIKHFMEIIENTDPDSQQEFADRFFSIGEDSDFLSFVDPVNNTSATFNHLDESYLWSEQAGHLGYGEQQLAPAGEISVLPLRIQEFDETLRLDFNGTIALHGVPILHNGTVSFLREDQKRIFDQLIEIKHNPIIATVENGVITALSDPTGKCPNALNMLNSMFNVDSRYRILWEIGFGVNTHNKILDGNQAMNETFGNTDGAIHFGLGLTPYTQYHLDIICPNTVVKNNKNEYLIGKEGKKILRNKSIGCPCIE